MQKKFETEPAQTEDFSKPKKKWRKKWWGILIIVSSALILIFLLSFSGYVYYYYYQIKSGKMSLPGSAKFLKSGQAAAPPKTFDFQRINPGGEPESFSDAPLAVVGFFDFQCPFSKEAYAIMREIQPVYAGKVNFVFRNFPLTELHSEAMLAAQAGECAYAQNQFWPMADKLFNSQNLAEENLKLYAQQIGLDKTQFSDCLDSYRSKGQILKDILDGKFLGLVGAPTWFIDNEKVEGVIPADVFKKIIDYLLAQKK